MSISLSILFQARFYLLFLVLLLVPRLSLLPFPSVLGRLLLILVPFPLYF